MSTTPLKVLMVSNLYPPHYRGGYEVRCAQVAEAMVQAGHDIRVLTTVFGLPLSPAGKFQPLKEVINGVSVDRRLHNYAFGPQDPTRPYHWQQAQRELSDARYFQQLLREFKPDVVNWWNMNGISMTLLPLPAVAGVPDVHWIEYPWMVDEYGMHGEKVLPFWNSVWDGVWGPKIARPLFRWMGRRLEAQAQREGLPTRAFPNRPTHISFVSEYLRGLYREGGLEFPSSGVLFGGVPVEPFYAPIDPNREQATNLRVLYAGQLTRDRGLHVAIEAIGTLPKALQQRITLTVAGPIAEAYQAYYAEMVKLVEALGLTERVQFLGKVSHEQIAATYKQHDLLLFMSMREEGLPLVMVEAMLAGCAVVTTGSGGAVEIAQLAQLPLVEKGNAAAVSALLSTYVQDRSQLMKVAKRGQEIALQELSLPRMMERWQRLLRNLITSGRGTPSQRDVRG
ncbi:MAG: glycosyltransferase family 4 protein [Nitrospiraceae bacterium]